MNIDKAEAELKYINKYNDAVKRNDLGLNMDKWFFRFITKLESTLDIEIPFDKVVDDTNAIIK